MLYVCKQKEYILLCVPVCVYKVYAKNTIDASCTSLEYDIFLSMELHINLHHIHHT